MSPSLVVSLSVSLVMEQSSRQNDSQNVKMSGYVYGERALESQAIQNEGQVICPKTKEIYSFKDAEKVYIM